MYQIHPRGFFSCSRIIGFVPNWLHLQSIGSIFCSTAFLRTHLLGKMSTLENISAKCARNRSSCRRPPALSIRRCICVIVFSVVLLPSGFVARSRAVPLMALHPHERQRANLANTILGLWLRQRVLFVVKVATATAAILHRPHVWLLHHGLPALRVCQPVRGVAASGLVVGAAGDSYPGA